MKSPEKQEAAQQPMSTSPPGTPSTAVWHRDFWSSHWAANFFLAFVAFFLAFLAFLSFAANRVGLPSPVASAAPPRARSDPRRVTATVARRVKASNVCSRMESSFNRMERIGSSSVTTVDAPASQGVALTRASCCVMEEQPHSD